jgi:hypothetical protein
MSTRFPATGIDDATTLPNPTASSTTNSPSHSAQHANVNDAVKAVETKIGTGASTPVVNTLLMGTGTGTSAWSALTSAQLAASISDETGTGKAVFATSPTLITPAVDTINESTPANGVTVGGVNMKSGALTTANSVPNAAVASGISSAKLFNPYKFSAYQNTSTSLPTDTWTKATLNSEQFDTGSNFDSTTNYRFTAPVTGFYQINAQVAVTTAGANSGVYMTAALYKNGIANVLTTIQLASGNGNSILRAPISRLLSLSIGDYLELYAKCGDARNIDGDAAASLTWMTGYLVSTT